ncbi:DUF3168 domain-containing protein [Sphingomonas sp. HT-1]|uniref:DUF3168 domain-containing protein n=1 Tax=unclassified Sphingomonas TaxID=196159 RepID=UPI0002E514E6|nr:MULTISPECIES: DUF3168 domain-containing protein [unclassified Sphingomonas]KTF69816.1 hypothetical protein ATB93_07175 [Sphingomonas sp. WG]
MTPQDAITGALRTALLAHPSIAGTVNGVFDADPGRTPRPYLLIEDPVLIDWSTKDQPGREGRLSVQVRDNGAGRQRLRTLAGAVETALAALPPAIGDGWRIASLVLLRSRVVAEGDSRVTAVIEFRVRMLRAG